MTIAQSTAIAVIDPRHAPLAAQVFGEDRLSLLAELVGRGWKVAPTPAELEAIALICQENRFDIFARPAQVHFIKRWDSKLNKEVMTPQTSIDGMRLVASRSRDYIGPAGYAWCGDDGVWKDVWLDQDPPRAARAGVYKRGLREPMYAVALWDEWAQWQDVYAGPSGNRHKTGEKELGQFWREKPAHMLAKTAEMIVLKQAFPAETNDLELAHLEELHRLEIPSRAAEYDRIYGADEDHAFAEMPSAYVSGRAAPVEHDGRTVDTASGEVLAEGGGANDSGVSGANVAPPRSERGSSLPTGAESAPDPQRAEMVAMYDTLLQQARRDGVLASGDQKWALRTRDGVVEIISKGRELRALVNAAQIERASHQQAPDPDPEPKLDLWARNRELVAEANKRKLSGVKTLPLKASQEDLAQANAELEERIRNYDDDQTAHAQSQETF